jgi:pimeloyl-ACP methyl ester carboxylesterase
MFSATVAGDGPPLLCLHGGPGLSDYLPSPDLIGLGDETAGWRRISYTQRGLSPSPTDGPFTLAQHVADAVAVLDDLGIERAVVLGHSWGGFLAALLAARHPDRVTGLVLVDSLGVAGDGGFGVFGEQMVARTPAANRDRMEALDACAMRGEGTDAEALESFRLAWPAYFADPASAPATPDDLRLRTAVYADGIREVMELLAGGGLAARVASYGGPVEVVYGLASPMPPEAALGTVAAYGGGRVTGVEGAGHFPWVEAPGCVAAALERLRARL